MARELGLRWVGCRLCSLERSRAHTPTSGRQAQEAFHNHPDHHYHPSAYGGCVQAISKVQWRFANGLNAQISRVPGSRTGAGSPVSIARRRNPLFASRALFG
jgi:hypothetical protein